MQLWSQDRLIPVACPKRINGSAVLFFLRFMPFFWPVAMVGDQVQCFDGTGTRLEFQAQETFGFIPVPDVLMEQAIRNVEVRAQIRE